MAGDDRLRDLEERYEGYKVYDSAGESIGKVDDLFVDERDRPEYIGVKMGLFGLSGRTLIPLEVARVNERDRVMEVAESKDRVKDAPHYNDDGEVDEAFEERIRQHFNLRGGTAGSYGSSTDATGAEGAAAGDNTMRGDDRGADRRGNDDASREAVGREEYRNRDDYDSDSAMSSASGGGATASGGMSDLETGDRESRGDYREGSREYDSGDERGGDRGDDRRDYGRGDEGARSGGGGTDDSAYREAYLEGYRQAIKDSSGGGSGSSGSAFSGSGEGSRSFDDAQDYQNASTDYRSGRDEGGDEEGSGGSEGGGRMRVRRLRRGS